MNDKLHAQHLVLQTRNREPFLRPSLPHSRRWARQTLRVHYSNSYYMNKRMPMPHLYVSDT